MKISVIIPCYNSEETIQKCLQSVIEQTYKVFEIIIIDDGSTDKTVFYIQDFISRNNTNENIILINQTNQGPSAARNVGLKIAQGCIIAFLDADDYWEINKMKTQIDFLRNHKDVYLCATAFGYKRIDEKFQYKTISFKELLYKNYFSTPTVIIRREGLVTELSFNELQRASEDYKLWLEIAYSHKCVYINEVLAYNQFDKCDFGDKGLSSNLWKMERGELQNYFSLLKESKIKFPTFLTISAYSLLKFIRRYLLTITK